jgi:Ca2+-binding EF-hand superfamily protein
MRKNTLAVIVSSTLLAAAASQAQPVDQANTDTSAQTSTQSTSTYGSGKSTDAKPGWSRADTDGSGTLSQAEIQASMPTIASNFSEIDTNSDGEVSHDEMHNYKMQHSQRQWQQRFSAADVNGDNVLDQAEAASLPMLSDKFSTVDADKDGRITTEEMRAHHLAMGEVWRDARKPMQHGETATEEADELRSTTSATSTTSTTTTTIEADADAADTGSTATDEQ